ncbi:MAG: SulP family inorganic anion transporter [Methylovulum sp.]|uniref:SulP family inorganic anion transporter n=1 Tax=Methylovulum sp. TaxID=1916980 RepID=UPI0026278D92|nr:SulP family inorganic anion transporter [Methylovulum sp.]MDD2723569.1 SulP family inorganic anion transporter [Methylovulum sp.]MDD5124165.1 SulP family inorganic anion transporter [Methylovulum sp.]
MSEVNLSVLPKTGLAGLKENWRSDLLSGFLVFLIAMPLCLGISMASGFPPSAGIISAVIGGVLVSRINGSFVTINGPAAGLIVVVLGAVQELGEGDAMAGYRYTLAAIVIASAFQVLMGYFKSGRLSSFFPASVVHGMLAAIGIIIMAKQIHVVLGNAPEKGSSLFSTIAQIPHSLINMNHEIAIIGFSGLAILILWSVVKNKYLKMIPAPLIVVLVGIGLGKLFDLDHEHIYLFLPDATFLPHHEETVGPKFLVSISDNFMSSFYFPDFSKVATLEFWEAVVSICLVGSLESLLSAMAVDKLDPYKRQSNLDKDLMAVGTGNLAAGLVGGLPMIAEIVRSSANVTNGAKTSWANFFHGLFLLIFVVVFPRLIHSIPLAALASLLVFTGFRLASPKEFGKVFELGKEQFFMFVITIIGVIATDLLIGVAIGIVVKLLIHISRGVKLNNLFKIHFEIQQPDSNTVLVKISGAAIFSNFMALKDAMMAVEPGKMVIFQLNDAYLLDHSVMEFMHHFQHDYEAQGGKCDFYGLEYHDAYSNHPLAARKQKMVSGYS